VHDGAATVGEGLWQLGLDGHDVVELEVATLLDCNPEVERLGVAGAQDPPGLVGG
jgi:hypothetical protein